jgi:NADPH2:quinone reductase
VVPYSIQTLMRLKPAVFREDLVALFDLLHEHKIKPLVAQRLSLVEARHAHELLGEGGIAGKIVLMAGTEARPSEVRHPGLPSTRL